ncbi:MAG: hypothetical protein R3Y50_05640 [Rikenellaceae bacterium]
MKYLITYILIIFYTSTLLWAQNYEKEGYIAIDSTSGRGKYLTISLEKEQNCVAVYIEEKSENCRLKEYQIERLEGVKWVVISRCKRENSGEFITFKPQEIKKLRLHFLKAEKMPNISKLIIYGNISNR